MNYANKYRVKRFSDVCGNKSVVGALKSSVKYKKIPDVLALYGLSGTCKSNLAYLLIKANKCLHPTEDGEPCCECDMCKRIDESLFVHDEPERNTGIFVFNMSVADEQESNMRKIINILRTPNLRRTDVFILINEFHNCSFKIQQELLVPLESVQDSIHVIITTTDFYTRIADGIKKRAVSYETEKVPSELVASRLAEVAKIEGIKITKQKLAALAKIKENNMRECLNTLEQLKIDMDNNWDNLMKKYTKNLTEFITYLKACKGGVMDLVEYIDKGENNVNFVSSLAVTLKEAVSLKHQANGLVDPAVRKELNELTRDISDKVLIDTTRELIGLRELSDGEADTLLLVIGARLNESIYSRVTMTDEENSLDKSAKSSNKGLQVLNPYKDDKGDKDDEISSDDDEALKRVGIDLSGASDYIPDTMGDFTGEVSLKDILGGDQDE